MKTLLAYIIVLLVLLAGGCSRVQVSQDYRSGADFSRYRMYQWQTGEQPESADMRVSNPLLHERFQQAINGLLLSRGYYQGVPADFLVGYSYRIQTRLESDPYDSRVGFGYGRYDRYGGVGFRTGGTVRQYDVGILVIDFSDARTGELIWRGTGSERVGTHSTPEDTTTYVNRMVYAILQQFPPL